MTYQKSKIQEKKNFSLGNEKKIQKKNFQLFFSTRRKSFFLFFRKKKLDGVS